MSRSGGAVGRWVVPVLVYAVLAVACTWPMALAPTDLLVGARRSDCWNSAWSLWFASDSLWAGHLPVETTRLGWPAGGRILLADPLNALLGVGLVPALGPVGALNLLLLLQVTAGAVAAHAFARRWGGSGWIAGVGYGFSPVVLGHLHNGASEAAITGLLPLALWAVAAAVMGPGAGGGGEARFRGSLRVGGSLFLCALGSWYAGVGAWVLTGCLLLVGWGTGDATGQPPLRTRARRLLPGLVVALVLTVPVGLAMEHVARADDGLLQIKDTDDLSRLRRTLGPADPRGFVTPGTFRSPDFSSLPVQPGDYVHVTYLGWGLLLLAVAGTRVRRRRAEGALDRGDAALWVGMGVSLVLALGPVLVVDGMPASVGGRAVPLPYRLLEALPGFEALSLLYRFVLPAVLCLAVLADRAVGRVRVLAPLLALGILVEARTVSPARGLPAVSAVPQNPALQALAREPEGGVLSLPPGDDRTVLFSQTLHGQPLCGGLNHRLHRGALATVAALRRQAGGEATAAEVVETARDAGVRYVVVRRDQLVDDPFLAAVRVLGDRWPVSLQDDDLRVWRLW